MSRDYLVVQCFGELGRRADDDGRAVVAPLVRDLLLIFHLFNVRDVALHVAQTTDLRMKILYLINSETLLSLHCMNSPPWKSLRRRALGNSSRAATAPRLPPPTQTLRLKLEHKLICLKPRERECPTSRFPTALPDDGAHHKLLVTVVHGNRDHRAPTTAAVHCANEVHEGIGWRQGEV